MHQRVSSIERRIQQIEKISKEELNKSLKRADLKSMSMQILDFNKLEILGNVKDDKKENSSKRSLEFIDTPLKIRKIKNLDIKSTHKPTNIKIESESEDTAFNTIQ
jgi:hypothetical protein